MQAIRGKDEDAAKTAIDDIIKSAPSENQERVEQLLKAVKNKEATQLTVEAQGQALARSMGASGKDSILLGGAKLTEGSIDVLGQLGSPKGMHVEMTRQSNLLTQIREGIWKDKGTWIKEDPKP